ncbi:MAG: hypothetical protein QQN63_06440 [Nitrosopumilus sp.]
MADSPRACHDWPGKFGKSWQRKRNPYRRPGSDVRSVVSVFVAITTIKDNTTQVRMVLTRSRVDANG